MLLLWWYCLIKVPSSYVSLQKKVAEEVSKCREREIPPVLNQKEFAALAESIENNDISDPEELSLGKHWLLLSNMAYLPSLLPHSQLPPSSMIMASCCITTTIFED